MGVVLKLHIRIFCAIFVAISITIASCEPRELFSDYEGVNLIAAYQFGEGDENGWLPDHEGANEYMRYEALSGAELDAARAVAGLPNAATVNVYRLEVKNQFVNGDFEDTTSPIMAAGDIGGSGGTGIWASTKAIADNELWVDNVNGNNYLEFNAGGQTLYADLSNALSTYADAEQYTFHIEFTNSGSGVNFANPFAPINFEFDNSSASNNGAYRTTLPGRLDPVFFFPGDYRGGEGNFWVKDDDSSRLYFGRSTGHSTSTTIDNIRFIRSDISYALRLEVPFSGSTRPDLGKGGVYTFSVYVKGDPSIGDNSFAADTIAMGIRQKEAGDGGLAPRSSTIFNRTTSDIARWEQLSISVSGPIHVVSDDPSQNVLQLSITASALDRASEGNENTVFKLDAGTILIALPELYYSAQ